MKIYHGIDITSVKRIQEVMEQNRKGFAREVFTKRERDYCQPKRRKYEHYAARFAAKEAVLKALTGIAPKKIPYKDIEVRHHATGKPYLHFTKTQRKKYRIPMDCQLELSLSHERNYAIASVIVVLH